MAKRRAAQPSKWAGREYLHYEIGASWWMQRAREDEKPTEAKYWQVIAAIDTIARERGASLVETCDLHEYMRRKEAAKQTQMLDKSTQ